MHKSLITILALVTLGFVAGEAAAKTIMTEQQVRNTCGSKLQSGSAGGATAMGCEKKCGSKTCTYGCHTPKGGKQTCSGEVVYIIAPKPGVGAPTGGILGSDPALPGQGPSRTGTGSGKPGGSGTIY